MRAITVQLAMTVLLAGSSWAGTVLTVSGTPGGPLVLATAPDGSIFDVGFSLSSTWTNVQIQGYFNGWAGPASEIDAVLSNTVGSGSTALNSAAIFLVSPPEWATLFSGLTLGPGSYHLVLGGANTGVYRADSSVITLGAGVTAGGSQIVCNAPCGGSGTTIDTANLANSTGWQPWGADLLLQITGNTGVPEPGTWVLTGGAVLVLWQRTRRASRR
jgi:hypothetical protein